MTPEQIREFLEKPRLADLATVRPDGSPQVTPVWYDYDGKVFRVVVEPAAIKVRNVRQNDRVSMSIPTDFYLVSGWPLAFGDPIHAPLAIHRA